MDNTVINERKEVTIARDAISDAKDDDFTSNQTLYGVDNVEINQPPNDLKQDIKSEVRSNNSDEVGEVCENNKKRKNRVFECLDCGKSFSQQAHLSIHSRKHTGERPYICGFEGCLKSFTQLGNLKTHERKHTGERPFECGHVGISC